MTPACRLLKAQKIAYRICEYTHDKDNTNFGQEAVEKLSLTADVVFKTLLVHDGKNYFVAVLPVEYPLNLKKLATALGVKKLVMANASDAERLTGYVVGGISPLAQKKKLPTLIATSALAFDEIYVSGGRRGLEVALSPMDLAKVLSACFADIVDE